MSANISQLHTPVTAEFWADRITKSYAGGVESVIKTGRDLLEAKARLPHGEWGRMTGQTTGEPMLPFSPQTAQKMMAVARCGPLSNAAHGRHLPSSWRTLAVLTQLPDPVLEKHIADGVVHAELERKVAEDLVREYQAQMVTTGTYTGHPAPQLPSMPPAMTPERMAMLEGEMSDALGDLEAAAQDAQAIRNVLQQRTLAQSTWVEVLARLGSIADLSVQLMRWLEDLLQPLPPPDQAHAEELRDRLANATAQLRTVHDHLTQQYLNRTTGGHDAHH
ncbi:MAG: DUF3102 domain-containing protein [Burkholderiaceae bacterium]|jgi:hypothetical protein|nr:DUF3102 domain-containing protein [Burkholderiaceae bacterium]